MPRARRSVFLVPILLLCAAFAQDPTDRVIAEAQKPSALETNLQQLTDQIGGRVPGTPAMRKAVEWGFAAFKDAGADVSLHWERGGHQLGPEDIETARKWLLSVSKNRGRRSMTDVAPET